LRAVIANKLTTVKECGAAVHKLLKEVNDAVKIDRKLPEWKNYTEYINSIVIEGVAASIVFALDHLNDQINSRKTDQQPLFDIKMELEGKKGVVFEPEIVEQQSDASRMKSVRDTIRGWINEVFSIAHTFPRLDTVGSSTGGSTSSGDYLPEIKDDFSVKYITSEITTNLDLIESDTKNIKDDFKSKYSYLWEVDPKESFEKFLSDNEPKDEKTEGEDVIQRANILLQGCREKIPDLELFDRKITELRQIQSDIVKIVSPIEKYWLKIDLRNLVKALEVRVGIWIKVYTDFLINEFKTTHKNLKEFTSRTNHGLKVNPKDVMAQQDGEELTEKQKEKNRKLLMNVMKHISEVKDVKSKIDMVLERMKSMVIKLKKHSIPIMEKG
jgi:dynein heavy chain